MKRRRVPRPARGAARLAFAAALAGAAAGAHAQAADAAWQLQAHYEHHLDGAPLKLFDSDTLWQTIRPRPGDNLAYVLDQVDVTRRSGDWSVSLLARERGEVVLNRDALEAARAIDGVDPTSSAHWTVRASAFAFVGGGLGVAHDWRPAQSWRLRTGVQLLALTRVIDRRITGWGSYDATTRSYDADLHSTEANDRLKFPFERSHASIGQALLSDGELGWQAGVDGAAASLRWQDVGLLQWRGLPQQRETLSNQLTQHDANGFVVYQPLVQGQNTQDRWRRWSIPLTEAEAVTPDTAAGRWAVGARYRPGAAWLPRIGARQAPGEWHLSEDWHLHERRADLAVARAGWRVSAGADLHSSHHSLTWGLAWSSADTPR